MSKKSNSGYVCIVTQLPVKIGRVYVQLHEYHDPEIAACLSIGKSKNFCEVFSFINNSGLDAGTKRAIRKALFAHGRPDLAAKSVKSNLKKIRSSRADRVAMRDRGYTDEELREQDSWMSM